MSAEAGLAAPRTAHRPRPLRAPLLLRLMAGDRLLEELPLVAGAAARGASFSATLVVDPPADPAAPVAAEGAMGRVPVSLTVECTAEAPVDAGLVVVLSLGPSNDPGWLIPGLFYGENRPAACTRRFPRYVEGAPDLAALEADHWSFRVDRAAAPVVFAWSAERGAALETVERGPLGQNGLGFAKTADGLELRLAFPYREEPMTYDGSEIPRPADLPTHSFEPGARVTLAFAVHDLPPDRRAWVPVLRGVHARLAAGSEVAPWLGVAASADLAAEGLLRWHYRPLDGGVLLETAAFERHGDGRGDEPGDRHAMHVGWVSGIPHAAAMLAHGRRRGDPALVEAGSRVIDNIVGHRAPCGTLWSQWSAERGWGKGWTPGDDRLHARTIGEAVTFLLRAARDEGAAGNERPGWLAAAVANLRFVVERQDDRGGLPSQWHGRSGAVESREGAAGLAWVPALVDGAAQLADPSLLDAARGAGEWYAAFVERDFLHGAPEDVDLAPTSEDGYVAVMAYVALLEAEPSDAAAARARWLELARRAADWTLSFRYAWNVRFAPETLLGAYDYRSLGADQASPANQHLHAYGLICLPEMVRLARHAGDDHYLVRTRENLACFRQFIARADGDFNARRGMAPERLYQTACFGPKGAIGPLSHAWTLGLLLAACDAAADIPELDDGR